MAAAASGTVRPSGSADLLFDGRLGQLLPQPPVAAQEVVRIEITQHQVGVGDGRLRPAQAVAGRARDGARAGRADLQAAAQVDGSDAAAPGAHGVHVHRRQPVFLAVDDLLLGRRSPGRRG